MPSSFLFITQQFSSVISPSIYFSVRNCFSHPNHFSAQNKKTNIKKTSRPKCNAVILNRPHGQATGSLFKSSAYSSGREHTKNDTSKNDTSKNETFWNSKTIHVWMIDSSNLTFCKTAKVVTFWPPQECHILERKKRDVWSITKKFDGLEIKNVA